MSFQGGGGEGGFQEKEDKSKERVSASADDATRM